jgi:hypothetical protein
MQPEALFRIFPCPKFIMTSFWTRLVGEEKWTFSPVGALFPLPDALCLLIEYVMQTCQTITCFFLANEKYERNTEHGK